MTQQARPHNAVTIRRARLAVAALFLTNGALFANLAPRYPEIKAMLGLNDAMFGFAVAAFPAGAITAGLLSAMIVQRFGSAAVAACGTVLIATGIVLATIVPSFPLLVAALFVAGALDAIVDVGQNAHGLRVQAHLGRSIINSFHALWSIGAVTGGAMAAGAIALGLSLTAHLALSGVVFSLTALIAWRFCLPGLDRDDPLLDTTTAATDDPGHTDSVRQVSSPKRTTTVVLISAFVLLATCGALVEDAGSSWATLYLGRDLEAAAAIAPLGFIALVGAQTIGRLTGDRLVDRFGTRAVVRAGGAIAALGMGLALAFPSVPGTIAGFIAAGFGVATLVPAAMHAADELPGLKRGTGLMLVSWLMRLGFLLSPPIVGRIAETTSLQTGLMVVPIAGVLVVLLSASLPTRRSVTAGTQTH